MNPPLDRPPCTLFVDDEQGARRGIYYLREASRPDEPREPLFATIKVVMLTTSEARADVERVTEPGADGYLIKFPEPALLAGVRRQAAQAHCAGSVPTAEAWT